MPLRASAWRRVVLLAAVALVPVAVLAASSIALASGQVTSVVNKQVQSTATVSAVVIGERTDSLVALVQSYATRPYLAEGVVNGLKGKGQVDATLASLTGADPGISASFVADLRGNSRDTYPYFPAVIGTNFAYREWFKGLVASGRPYVSSAIETKEADHTLAVTVTDYIRGLDGRPVGILGVNYRLQFIRAYASSIAHAQGITLSVTDRVGTSLTATGARGLVSLSEDPRVKAALAGGSGQQEYSPLVSGGGHGPNELSAYAPIPGSGWAVIASKPKSVALAGLVQLRVTVLGITALLVLVLLTGLGLITGADRRRRTSELQLQSRDRELAKVLESTDESFVSVDLAGVITAWNAQAEELSGWAAHEVLGRPLIDTVIPANDREMYRSGLGRYRSGSGLMPVSGRMEAIALHRDGSDIAVEVGFWSHDDGEGLSAFVHDITERVTVATVREEDRRRLTEAQQLGQMGSFECDIATGSWSYTEQMHDLLGAGSGRLSPQIIQELVVEADRELFISSWDQGLLLGGRHSVEFRICRAVDRVERVLRSTIEVDLEPQTQPPTDTTDSTDTQAGTVAVRMRGTYLDITDITAAEKAAQRANAFFDAVLVATPDFTFVSELTTGAIVYASRDRDLLGRPSHQIQTLPPQASAERIHPEDQPRMIAINKAAADLQDGQVLQLRYRAQDAEGQYRWLSRRITPFRRDDSGRVVEVLGVIRDVTDVMESENRLTHAALHDRLTALPNRALLMDRLEAALARSARDGREVGVLFCDLDGFKRVNDIAGHSAGDALLLEIANRLRKVVREYDTVARVGGDEFVIVVEPWNRADPADDGAASEPGMEADRRLAIQVAERVATSLQRPVTVNGVEHVVSVSIGITYATLAPGARAGTVTAEQVLQDADTAMYLAKGRGKDRFEVFEHGLSMDLAERGRIERLLREGLSQLTSEVADPDPAILGLNTPRFAAAYQPVFDSDAGTLTGFEALARLNDSDGLEVAPDRFIPVAEETGIIHSLGRAMLGLACGQLKSWRAEFPELEHVSMAVNVSALQAQHSALADDVHSALQAHNLDASDLVLELTETALLQVANSTISTLQALRAEGVGIAIDDFGVGYASLRYLTTLPVSAVKIDRSFTAEFPHNQTSRTIVNAVAALAADMDLTCIIEGVETREQLSSLPRGVHVQGFLTGRPQNPEAVDILALLSEGSTQHRHIA
jgi:PAS domain S-box-containing protein